MHSYLPSGPRAFVRSALKFRVLGRGASIICVNEVGAAEARRRGASSSRLTVIENAIDTARFGLVDPAERATARAAVGLADSDLALVHFAWDWEVKGGPLFSETVAQLRSRGLPVVGLSVGAGDHARAASQSLGLGDALRPLEPTDDVRGLYAMADAMVAASAAEGAPLAMLEALSTGLGIVATSIPGHRLDGNPPGALRLGGNTPAEMADAIEATLGRDEATRSAEAAAAHEWVVANRDLDVWSDRVLAVYDSLLSSGNAAAISAGGSS
jgi:glycosyltransferase involved in cell wall biosynthesis